MFLLHFHLRFHHRRGSSRHSCGDAVCHPVRSTILVRVQVEAITGASFCNREIDPPEIHTSCAQHTEMEHSKNVSIFLQKE